VANTTKGIMFATKGLEHTQLTYPFSQGWYKEGQCEGMDNMTQHPTSTPSIGKPVMAL